MIVITGMQMALDVGRSTFHFMLVVRFCNLSVRVQWRLCDVSVIVVGVQDFSFCYKFLTCHIIWFIHNAFHKGIDYVSRFICRHVLFIIKQKKYTYWGFGPLTVCPLWKHVEDCQDIFCDCGSCVCFSWIENHDLCLITFTNLLSELESEPWEEGNHKHLDSTFTELSQNGLQVFCLDVEAWTETLGRFNFFIFLINTLVTSFNHFDKYFAENYDRKFVIKVW